MTICKRMRKCRLIAFLLERLITLQQGQRMVRYNGTRISRDQKLLLELLGDGPKTTKELEKLFQKAREEQPMEVIKLPETSKELDRFIEQWQGKGSTINQKLRRLENKGLVKSRYLKIKRAPLEWEVVRK